MKNKDEKKQKKSIFARMDEKWNEFQENSKKLSDDVNDLSSLSKFFYALAIGLTIASIIMGVVLMKWGFLAVIASLISWVVARSTKKKFSNKVNKPKEN